MSIYKTLFLFIFYILVCVTILILAVLILEVSDVLSCPHNNSLLGDVLTLVSINESLFLFWRLKPGSEELIEEFEAEIGCKLERVSWLPDFYSLPPDIHIASSKAYREGKVNKEDKESILVRITLCS